VQVGLITLRIRIGPSASLDADIGVRMRFGYEIKSTFYVDRCPNATAQCDVGIPNSVHVTQMNFFHLRCTDNRELKVPSSNPSIKKEPGASEIRNF